MPTEADETHPERPRCFGYNNSRDIVKEFYRQSPHQNLEKNLYDDLWSTGPVSKKDALLYLQCSSTTEASMRIARRVASGPMRSVIDDPQEVRVQPFAWYVQQVTSAFAIVCHFLSTEYQNWQQNNAKHALIAGLAHGAGKPLLMLAHEPYSSPLDYQDLLRKHATAAAAESIFADWSLPLIDAYEKRILATASYQVEKRAQTHLRDLTVGEPVAEFESDVVPDYFVSTAVYSETLHSKYSIVVGRKGTGKTATLYALTEKLRGDPRNHICVIKPVGYELEGLMSVLSEELERADKGYLVESFWKFLVYTELTKGVYEELLAKPSYYKRSPAETALCELIEEYKSLITPEFSSRLETAVGRLRDFQRAPTAEGRRLKISELLHHEMLSRLRVLLGEVLSHKGRVSILIDNLDKAWNPNTELALLSELLFGLLSVSKRVAEEFWRDASGRASVNLYFVLFLRSDIYAAMLQFAKERDKLPVRLLIWDDSDLLKRVIEQRFMNSDPEIQFPQQVWEKYFPPTTGGLATWEYIGERIHPRPRDLIYLIKSALQLAVNRGRTRVEAKDIIDGEKPYSRFALDSLIVEAAARISNIEDLLLHFVQSSEIVTENQISDRVVAANMPASETHSVTTLLVELTFLGFEVAPNRFEFLYDEQDERKMSIMARKTADETTNGVRRFRIHPAFHAFLEIKPQSSAPTTQLTINL